MSPCDTDPDLWFSESPKDIEKAKDGCLDCPLSKFNACRRQGQDHEFGVFGGMSAADRKKADPSRFAGIVETSKEEAADTDDKIRSARLKMMIELHDQGVTYAVIGSIFGVSEDAIRKRIKRSRPNLATVS